MLLTSIVTGIIYSAYLIIEKQYTNTKNTDEKIASVSLLNYLLEKDFKESKSVINNHFDLVFHYNDNKDIFYSFEKENILRKSVNMVDTFWMSHFNMEIKFLNKDAEPYGLVDELHFEATLFDKNLTYRFSKKYASDVLVN